MNRDVVSDGLAFVSVALGGFEQNGDLEVVGGNIEMAGSGNNIGGFEQRKAASFLVVDALELEGEEGEDDEFDKDGHNCA